MLSLNFCSVLYFGYSGDLIILSSKSRLKSVNVLVFFDIMDHYIKSSLLALAVARNRDRSKDCSDPKGENEIVPRVGHPSRVVNNEARGHYW